LSEKDIQDSIRLNLRQIRPFMARKEGRHDFFYESFKLAAEERYADDRIDTNRLLANYFMSKADSDNDNSFNVIGKDKLRPLNELPHHLNESEDYGKLSDVLSSYAFIKNKMEKSDIYNLILDYQFDPEHKFMQTEDHPIVLIGRALELSAPVLDRHEDQLPAQLWGRMCEIGDETIQKLLRELEKDSNDEWLKSKSTALYSPKSSIIKRINPDGKKSTTAISMVNDNEIIIGSEDGILNLFDINDNDLATLEEGDSKVIKIILNDDGTILVANADGTIKEWDINNKMVTKKYPKIDAEITDIYLSKTYNKIYASSHTGVYSIDLETNELRREDIENKNYNQILVPRRNEAILVCDEKEVDGWDVYEMRKAYNRHHQQNQEEEEGSETGMDSSEEIRFMGLNKRFLTLISENGQMKFWNTLKNSGGGESIDEEFVCGGNDKFKQAKTLEDEDQIVTMSEMGVLKVYNIPNPRQPKFNTANEIQTGIRAPTAIDYYKNGENQWVIVGNENNDVSVIDLNKKVEEAETEKHNDTVLSIKLHDNNMITASENGEVYTWNFDAENIGSTFANDFRNECVSYNYSESRLASAGVRHEKDGRVINKIATWTLGNSEAEDYKTTNSKVVDIAQNSSGIVFIEEDKLTVGNAETKLDNAATTLATIFDSDEIFVGFEDGNIVKYPSESKFENVNASQVRKIKISENKLIAGFGNGAVEIFDLSGSHIKTLKDHEKAITNINIKGSQLITVSEDNTLKFWDMESGKCEYTYFLDIYATSINFREDKLVIGDTLGNVRFFNFENVK
jgi:WD40 repeat protein